MGALLPLNKKYFEYYFFSVNILTKVSMSFAIITPGILTGEPT